MGGGASKSENGSRSSLPGLRETLYQFAKDSAMDSPDERFTILLLGAGDSGKSTMMRHIKRLYSQPEFRSEKNLAYYKGLVFINIIKGMCKLVEAHVASARGDATMALRCVTGEMGEETKKVAAKLVDWNNDPNKKEKTPEEFTEMPENVKDWLLFLWKDKVVRETHIKEGQLRQRQLEENIHYFMSNGNFERVTASNYKPTDEDMINVRHRTEGSEMIDFLMPDPNWKKKKKKPDPKPIAMKVIDVGGQLQERKHWIGHFEKAHVVLFFSAINDWDKMMLENPRKSRDQDSKELFKLVVTCPYFETIPIFLFMNKVDEFAGKLANTNFKDTFKDFDESKTGYIWEKGKHPPVEYFMEAINYNRRNFEAISLEHRSELSEFTNVCTSLTCMTDISNFDALWSHMWRTPLNELDGKVSDLSWKYAKKYATIGESDEASGGGEQVPTT